MRVLGEGGEVFLDTGVGRSPNPFQERDVVRVIVHLTGHVVHRLVATSRLCDQPLQELAKLEVATSAAVFEAVLQHSEDRPSLVSHPGVRLGDAQQDAFETRARVERHHAVVGDCSLDALDKTCGQVGALCLEVVEVVEEVLLAASPALGDLRIHRVTPEQGDDVDEDPQDLVLRVAQPNLVRGIQAQRSFRVDQAVELCRGDVPSEEQGSQLGQVVHAPPMMGVRRHRKGREVDAATARFVVHGRGVDDDQRCSGSHLDVLPHQQLADGAGVLRGERCLHLHGLDHRDAIACRHLVTGLHRQRDDDRG